MRTFVYGGHLRKWPPLPFRAKFEMALYPNIFLFMCSTFCAKFHTCIIKRTIHSHIGWTIRSKANGNDMFLLERGDTNILAAPGSMIMPLLQLGTPS